MPSLRDVKKKIESVEKTKQITKAMNMVSSAKLNRAQERILKFRPYADKFYEILSDLAEGVDPSIHPLLETREEIKTVGILLITSDKGLCGAFNSNLIKHAFTLADKKKSEGKNIKFYCVGRKGRDAVRKSEYEMMKGIVDRMNRFDFTLANEVGMDIIFAYEKGELDEVHMIYGNFINVLKQVPKDLQILPVVSEKKEKEIKAEYIYEPSVEGILHELLPRFVKVQIYRGLLDTSASEHAARMTAMDNATKNCEDMIHTLTLAFNKARQAAITAELMDIVGGAEALRSST